MNDLGNKIRQKRIDLGLNISDLADKSGLSPSLISQVERNKVTPSINNVVKIATALNSTMAEFFEEEDAKFSLKRKGTRNVAFTENNEKKYEFLAPIHGRKIESILITLNQFYNPDDELISHLGEESGYVLKGSMIVNLNGEKHTLHEGDSIYFSSDVPHMYESYDDKECISIWSMTPPSW